jgi:hypothetical protein
MGHDTVCWLCNSGTCLHYQQTVHNQQAYEEAKHTEQGQQQGLTLTRVVVRTARSVGHEL